MSVPGATLLPMTLFVAGAVTAALLSGFLSWFMATAVARAKLAGLIAERDLLRERVTDLEVAIGLDQ